MKKNTVRVRGLEISKEPRQYFALLPGKWLLANSTPSPRIDDPVEGFQRLVNQARAKEIAKAVIARNQNFPNAIVLASALSEFEHDGDSILVDASKKLFVVDGQHRLWAQKYSEDAECLYNCVIHCGLSVRAMAELFLDINDHQKRVPSSLRWDLYRLVHNEDEPLLKAASELVKDLNTIEDSPLFGLVDPTGEVSRIGLKQGSLAPEIYHLINHSNSVFKVFGYQTQYNLLSKYLAAIKALDSSGWKRGDSQFYQARILRVLIRLLPEILKKAKKTAEKCTSSDFLPYLQKIDPRSVSQKALIAKQGSAGMSDIYKELRKQVFA
jgi:DGQHR domain-containing protein